MTDSASKDDSPCTATGSSVALSIRELGTAEGRARWADTLDRTYCEMDVDWGRSRDRFTADLVARPMGELTVSVVHADPHTVVRTPAMIASDPNDDFLLCLITRGSAVLEQDSRRSVLRNGAFGILDSSLPFMVDGTTEFEQIVLRAPRDVLASRLPVDVVREMTGAGISGQAGLGRLVSRFLVDVAAADTPLSTGSADSVAGAVLDLLATALCEYATPLTATARVHAEDLRRVQHLMARRMHDPDQTLTEVGAELGMSLRYIHKLFSAAGTTPRTWLYDLRLARARTLLLDTDRTVADISVQVGFRDVSHFSRAFRRRFGASPAHFRAQRAVGS
ncbi:AraC family transcriptional regulator [Nocardia farcinica]|uniref:Putative transcriptional regulator n=1 Tax=Nocardia farcinica (strain IFM 10152) TaxID=247156 RepID=Q5YV84_NOCFA|nr:AraC family transcriptional regulator [Nocardia farcinica]MBA4856471.1 AraC family transcriptional regulator [Nocardia farcinica]MBC9814297.1 AraC family transcriptional regulator [Nocardia farcinica]MBF6069785.1 AraC family transcriptional regulator [Nocardia farcinica]MBF6358728.1 AraC family transcriptional regulator [Nocardia farcinica]MBF6418011.1 AraC family transcriptional regulator [Nocardia farcinica]